VVIPVACFGLLSNGKSRIFFRGRGHTKFVLWRTSWGCINLAILGVIDSTSLLPTTNGLWGETRREFRLLHVHFFNPKTFNYFKARKKVVPWGMNRLVGPTPCPDACVGKPINSPRHAHSAAMADNKRLSLVLAASIRTEA